MNLACMVSANGVGLAGLHRFEEAFPPAGMGEAGQARGSACPPANALYNNFTVPFPAVYAAFKGSGLSS
jgi:hypothetical protein